MKRMIRMFMALCALSFTVLAGDEEVTVKVSVAGDNNSALRKQCEVQGKKTAVKKYLVKMGNAAITDKVIDEAMSSYAKFVEDIEADEQEYEDGELTCSYTVTIKQTDLAKWLEGEGIDLNAVGDAGSLEIFVMEEPPDAGQMQLGDEVGNFSSRATTCSSGVSATRSSRKSVNSVSRSSSLRTTRTTRT